MTCPLSLPDTAFVSGVLNFVDCQAQQIGGGGYQALATPGSPFSLLLGGLLTLFVALFGFRMLMGRTPGVGDGVTAAVKIGLVLALAGSWPFYRTFVYDLVLSGPAELTSTIGGPAALPGAGGGLVARLDVADFNMTTLAVLGPGDPNAAALQAQQQGLPVPNVAPQPFSSSFAFGFARLLFLGGAIGGFAALRIIAGLLLALGPFFAAFLLFDNTRGLFEGWVRVLGGAALGTIACAIVLGIELALIEPWLPDLIGRRIAGEALPAAPGELLVVTFVFDIVLVAAIVAAARVARGFRLARVLQAAEARVAGLARSIVAAPVPLTREGSEAPAIGRSRAATVVDAVSASQRREVRLATAAATMGAGGQGLVGQRTAPTAAAGARDASVAAAPPPLGQSMRRTRGRVSAIAGRRDRS